MLYSLRGSKLCELVKKELIEDLKKENTTIKKEGLTMAEIAMFYAAARGGNAECSFGGPTLSSTSQWGCWNDWNFDRLIRAEVLRWLCTATEALKLVDPRGIHIRNALIKKVCKSECEERKADLDVDLDVADIRGSFYLWQCAIPGGIQLRDAKVTGLLSLAGCITSEVRIDRIEAHKHVWLGIDPDEKTGGSWGFKAEDSVSALGADIRGDLYLGGCKTPSLSLKGAIVDGTLNLQGAEIEDIDLTGASVASLEDSQSNWPKKEKLHLKGFRYKTIISPTDANSRLEWLRLQPADDLQSPQPYEQLAGVLREMGHRSDAKSVLYEKENMLMKRERSKCYRKTSLLLILYTLFILFIKYVMHLLWKWIAGYGYYPWRAFVGIILFWIIGWIVFAWAYSEKIMYQIKQPPDPNRQFVAYVYSLDVMLPVIDFGEESCWHPKHTNDGELVLNYQWGHTLVGYVLTIAFLAALSGFFSRSK